MAIEVRADEAANPQTLEEALRIVESLDIKEGTVLAKDGMDSEVKVNEVVDAGLVSLWDTRNGELSVIHRNSLLTMLRKKDVKTGKRIFSATKPAIKPKRGTLLCLLHPKHPQRSEWDVMGLPTCPKGTLTSPFQVQMHMRRYHKIEWETIESERTEREKQSDKDFQRGLLQAAKTVGTAAQPNASSFPCPNCGRQFPSKDSLKMHLIHERREQGGQAKGS